MEECLDCLPALFRQESPWCPSEATGAPHRHWCPPTTGQPTRRPTAMLSSLSPKRSPKEGDGSASSQLPDPGALADSMEALPPPSEPARRTLNLSPHIGSSYHLCPCGRGIGKATPPLHPSHLPSATLLRRARGIKWWWGKRAATKPAEAATDARNAGRANSLISLGVRQSALPIPPISLEERRDPTPPGTCGSWSPLTQTP